MNKSITQDNRNDNQISKLRRVNRTMGESDFEISTFDMM